MEVDIVGVGANIFCAVAGNPLVSRRAQETTCTMPHVQAKSLNLPIKRGDLLWGDALHKGGRVCAHDPTLGTSSKYAIFGERPTHKGENCVYSCNIGS